MRSRRWVALVAATLTLTALGPTGMAAATNERPGHGSGWGPGGKPDKDHEDHEDHEDQEEEKEDKDDDSTGSTGSGGKPGGGSAGGTGGAPSGSFALSFKVASFNILGSQHTAGARRRAAGTVRAKMAKDWLRGEGTSVVGLSEGQVDQMRVLTRGGTWTSYPNPRTSTNSETAQSVAWLSSRWKKVKAESFTIPFDITQTRKQPMVLLEHRATGKRVWVVSVHFTSGHGPRAVKERRVATTRLIRQVRRLEGSAPVVVTGDMNDHATFFCRFSAGTSLVSPAGGSHNGSCSPPRSMRIDWIFGSQRLAWSGFRFAQSATLNRITDHTVPVATVHVPAG